MNTGGRVATAVAAGYLLGRTKKLKLAIAVGSMMAGKRIATSPRGLARQANELIESNDQLSQLSDEVREKLVTAARTAAISVASNRLESFSDSLHDRSEQWRQVPDAAGELTPDVEQAEDEQAEDEEPEDEEPEDERPAKKAPAKKSSTKKTSAKKAPAKKSSTKKASAKKAPAKKSSTKKASAKKAPARKTSTKKTSGRRSTSSRTRS